ncbi:MAG: hypothetical protein PF508_02130 [Spirochaeta sp.]|jgi:hypothetical protein|nr:hypothetical protein [Spirochaeta sp.]
MQKRTVTTVAILLLIGAVGHVTAQSNQIIDEVLAQDQIDYGHAIYLLLSAGGIIDDDATVEEAHRLFESGPASRSNGSTGGSARLPQTPLGYPPDHPVTLGEFSLLTMETFGISGGWMYTITSRPRYAARELAFRNVIQGRAYPRMELSGERAMRIVGRVLALEEEGRLR